jgi:hypothetical protein
VGASVGIFWFVPAPAGRSQILIDATPLCDAPAYGECLTHDRGHAEFWELLARMGATDLARAGYPTAPATSEYDDWPRGRTVYELRASRYVIYADRQLHRPAFISRVREAMQTESGAVIVRADEHYAKSRRIGEPC